MNKIRVLFISRKYPPSVGGMQRLSYHLISQMSQRVQAVAITWGGSQIFLPLFMAYALARSLWICLHGIDLINIGDPVIAPIGWILKKALGVPTVAIVHGLDITFLMPLYQWLIPRLLRKFDRIVCISTSARTSCAERGIPVEKCTVIHPGVTVPPSLPPRETARRRLEKMLRRNFNHATILVTVGRLVPRKGVAWFLEYVFPRIIVDRADVYYMVVGDGPEQAHVLSLAVQPDLAGRVLLLGHVSDDELTDIYTVADLFIMPNLPVYGDMEGFGLVALEAAAHAVPVLAADLEGIRDAIVPEYTGRLLPSGDADVWVKSVLDLLNQPSTLRTMASSARNTVRERFDWGRMANAYEVLYYAVCREQRL
jgi:glycosyltransferase involved in cell wall biosynthesis